MHAFYLCSVKIRKNALHFGLANTLSGLSKVSELSLGGEFGSECNCFEFRNFSMEWNECCSAAPQVLACQKGTITIDNTVDSRLQLVMEQAGCFKHKTL